jgi:hypothetical protein
MLCSRSSYSDKTQYLLTKDSSFSNETSQQENEFNLNLFQMTTNKITSKSKLQAFYLNLKFSCSLLK